MNTLGCLGRYELIREIARSNDVVWEAWDPLTNRRVAIKELMIPQGATREAAAERTERFQREARAIASLNHPGIVSLYDFGLAGTRRFIVLELMEAGTLAVEIARGPMAPDRIARVFVQLLEALEIAHRAGIIHRDIKPQNIFVLPDGRIKLADFGIASLATERTITLNSQVLGTLHYLSPEQANGDKAGPPSDVWAVGAVMFEAATGGLRPFEGSSIGEVVHRISASEPDWSLLRGNVPRNLVKKALAKSPRDRYSSAMEYLRAVRDWQEAESVPAAVRPSSHNVGAPTSPHVQAPQIQQGPATPPPRINQAQGPAPQPQSRNTSLAWLVGIGFLIFFVVRGINNVRASSALPPPQSYPSFEPAPTPDYGATGAPKRSPGVPEPQPSYDSTNSLPPGDPNPSAPTTGDSVGNPPSSDKVEQPNTPTSRSDLNNIAPPAHAAKSEGQTSVKKSQHGRKAASNRSAGQAHTGAPRAQPSGLQNAVTGKPTQNASEPSQASSDKDDQPPPKIGSSDPRQVKPPAGG